MKERVWNLGRTRGGNVVERKRRPTRLACLNRCSPVGKSTLSFCRLLFIIKVAATIVRST